MHRKKTVMIAVKIMSSRMSRELLVGSRIQVLGLKNLTLLANPFELQLFMFSHVWFFCGPVDCSPPGSSVLGISQARILEWVVKPSSRGSSQPRDWTLVSCIGRRILYWWPAGRLFSLHRGLYLRKGVPLLGCPLSLQRKSGVGKRGFERRRRDGPSTAVVSKPRADFVFTETPSAHSGGRCPGRLPMLEWTVFSALMTHSTNREQ